MSRTSYYLPSRKPTTSFIRHYWKTHILAAAFLIMLTRGCTKETLSGDSFDEPDSHEPESTEDTLSEDFIEIQGEPEAVDDISIEDIAEEDDALTGIVGDPCHSVDECLGVPGETRECVTGFESYNMEFPGGYCSASCTSSAECGDGADCIDLVFVQYCFKLCTHSSQCRAAEGYLCSTIPDIQDSPCCVPPYDTVDE